MADLSNSLLPMLPNADARSAYRIFIRFLLRMFLPAANCFVASLAFMWCSCTSCTLRFPALSYAPCTCLAVIEFEEVYCNASNLYNWQTLH